MRTTIAFASLFSCLAVAETPLKRERSRFEREAAAALAPVRESYVQRLKTALESLTKTGRLDDALEVRNELNNIAGIKPGNEHAPIIGQQWEWQTGEVIFGANGLVKSADGGWEARGLLTSWKHLGNGVVILHIDKGRDNQKIALLLFTTDWRQYTGWSFDGTVIPTRRRVK